MVLIRALKIYAQRTLELVLRRRIRIVKIFLEDALLLLNRFIQLLKLRFHGLKVLFRTLRVLSRVIVRAIVMPRSEIVRGYTNTHVE